MTFLDQYIVSRTKNRMRLRIPQLKSNETAVKIFDEVRNVAGIETADINETTGSLLIRFVPELFDEQQLEKILQHNLEGLPVSSRCAPEKILRSKEASQGGERQHDALWRRHPCINLAEKLETPYICGNRVHRVHAFAYVSVPKDFDEITQGLQDSEAFFLSLL